jgi:hypothetical protein
MLWNLYKYFLIHVKKCNQEPEEDIVCKQTGVNDGVQHYFNPQG